MITEDFTELKKPFSPPERDCPLCPRLADHRADNRHRFPEWWNSPVPSMGDTSAWLVIIGLAPGLKGANRTGLPFIGDESGTMLFDALSRHGLASLTDDPLAPVRLHGTLISNAVRCLPPENRPTPKEVHACRPFLEAELKTLSDLKVVLALGTIAHQSTVKALGGKLPKNRFEHGAVHRMPSGMIVIDSYHCSRYNQNTGRLTADMLDAVLATAISVRPS